jgi:EAL domain-containing protein (putative c-di-GMP-specific phosphodiesterase class I)
MDAPVPPLPNADLDAPGSAQRDAQGPARFRTTHSTRAQAIARRQLEADLRRAIERDAISLQYQPRVALGTGEVRGAEALLRWSDRKHGLVSPAHFSLIAERSALIVDLGGWALLRACVEAANWPGLRVSVNASARQLAGGELLDQVASALDESGLPPERLEVEITERLLIEVDTETVLVLSAIRDLGVGLALDDFGTGHASLAVLKHLPLTAMKLDRSLVRELPGARDDAVIVRAAVDAARALGLHVVAEGVETEEQRAFLSAIGCDEGQGTLFGQPVPASVLEWRRAA